MELRDELIELLMSEKEIERVLDEVSARHREVANQYYSQKYGIEIGSIEKCALRAKSFDAPIRVTEFITSRLGVDMKPSIRGYVRFKFGWSENPKTFAPHEWTCEKEIAEEMERQEMAGNR